MCDIYFMIFSTTKPKDRKQDQEKIKTVKKVGPYLLLKIKKEMVYSQDRKNPRKESEQAASKRLTNNFYDLFQSFSFQVIVANDLF